MSDQQASYRQTFKATGIFGSVQVFNILIGIAKSKVTALFLGTAGVGILALFNNALDLIRTITGLGINTSAVRDISEANGTGDQDSIVKTITTVRRLCWGTGLLGMVSMIVLSPLLSEWVFNSDEYTLSFVFLSVIPLFTSLSYGQLSLLQGLRRITYLAKANLYGGAVSLVFVVPLYWQFGIQGIVPQLIIASFISLLFSYYFAKKLAIQSVPQQFRETLERGKGMIRLGVMLTLSAFITSLISILIKVFVTSKGGVDEVGLYGAAFTILETYTGLVFTAMSADYFPRLVAVNKDNLKMKELVNCQIEIAVLMLAPMIVVFILFAPFLLTLFYSAKFTPVTTMMQYAMLAVLLKATSWPLAMTLTAKANNKVFLLKEIASGIYYLGFSIMGYYLWGLTGLGIGFGLAYVCNLIQIMLINKILYNITLTSNYFSIIVPQLTLCVATFLTVRLVPNQIIVYSLGIILTATSLFISHRELDKRIDLKSILKKYLNR